MVVIDVGSGRSLALIANTLSLFVVNSIIGVIVIGIVFPVLRTILVICRRILVIVWTVVPVVRGTFPALLCQGKCRR
jgi:hypothetical protein